MYKQKLDPNTNCLRIQGNFKEYGNSLVVVQPRYQVYSVGNCGFGYMSNMCLELVHSECKFPKMAEWGSYRISDLFRHLKANDLDEDLLCKMLIKHIDRKQENHPVASRGAAGYFISDRINNVEEAMYPYGNTSAWMRLLMKGKAGKVWSFPVAWSNPYHKDLDHSIIQAIFWTPPHMEHHIIKVPEVKTIEHVVQHPPEFVPKSPREYAVGAQDNGILSRYAVESPEVIDRFYRALKA